MSDPYAPKRARVAALLHKWNTGTVTLTRITRAARDPDTLWMPGAPTPVVYTLDARVDGDVAKFTSETIDGDVRVVIASPKATASDGSVLDIVPRLSDSISIDGVAQEIKKIEAVPAAGDAARFHIFIAS